MTVVTTPASAPGPEARGAFLARAVRGCWRERLEPLDLRADELERVLPIAMRAGLSGLVYRRIAHMSDGTFKAPIEFRDTARFLALRDGVRSRDTCTAFHCLRESGIEPILIKGWSSARLYADPATRPAGDIDLLVPPGTAAEAAGILERERIWVDLDHEEYPAEHRYRFHEAYGRSVLASLDGIEIRCLCPEDHLRLLCRHLLRHAVADGLAPLGLCDIAAAVEARPAVFDWDLAIGSGGRERDWAIALLGLGERLLGMETWGTPGDGAGDRLPPWLPRTVLREWAEARLAVRQPPAAIHSALSSPRRLAAALAARWHDPLQASVRLRVRFGHGPRLPYQLAVYGVLATRYRRNRSGQQAELTAAFASEARSGGGRTRDTGLPRSPVGIERPQ